MDPTEAVGRHLQQLNLIAFAILSGVMVMSGVVWFLVTSGTVGPSGDGTPSHLGWILNLIGILVIFTAHFIFPALLKPPRRGAEEGAILAWHSRATVLGLALREGGAITALAGALVTGQLAGSLAVAGLSVLSMVLAWPRGQRIEEVLKGVP